MPLQGLGIGLNLTYGLVRAMGGELRAESSPGNTRFWFVLPVESAHTIEAASTYTATRSEGGGASGLVPNAASPRLAEWARSGRAEKQQRRRNWNSISSGCPFSSAGNRICGTRSGFGGMLNTELDFFFLVEGVGGGHL